MDMTVLAKKGGVGKSTVSLLLYEEKRMTSKESAKTRAVSKI